MKTTPIKLLLSTIFIWSTCYSWSYADSLSYERVRTLIWKHTIHFIYEDNNMVDQYWKNYPPHFFNGIADFENLKDTASEKKFYTVVQDSISQNSIEIEKAKLEREVDAIIRGLKNNRKAEPGRIAKVDLLQFQLFNLIERDYQPEPKDTSAISESEESADEGKASFPYGWVIITLLVILLGFTGFVLWRMRNMLNWMAEEISTIRQHVQFNSNIYPGSDDSSLSRSDLQVLENQINEIQKETESLIQQMGDLHTLMANRAHASGVSTVETATPTTPDSTMTSLQDTPPITENRPMLFYAKKPNNDLFKLENLTPTARHDSIYRIQEEKEGTASFSINNDKKVQDYALQNGGEMFLTEACEIQYENNRPVRITTHTPGKLVKEGKHWRIQEKAKVILK